MSGGRLQLSVKGIEFNYLSYKPKTTLFKSCYQHLTNFAIETTEHQPNGTVKFNSKCNFIIPNNGDLLSHIYLNVTLPDIQHLLDDNNENVKLQWVNNIGHALLKSVELYIGNKMITRMTDRQMDIMSEMIEGDKKHGLFRMIGKLSREKYYESIFKSPTIQQLTIPLPFWFSKSYAEALPICSMSDPIRIVVNIRTFNDLIISEFPLEITRQLSLEVNLLATQIYLDKMERQQIITTPSTYIIEQTQHQSVGHISPSMSSFRFDINFNHPIKELVWVIQRNDRMEYMTKLCDEEVLDAPENIVYGKDIFNYSPTLVTHIVNKNTFSLNDNNTFTKARINFNGTHRTINLDANYFRFIQPYQHNNAIPQYPIYQYSFATNLKSQTPSGFCNFTPIKDANIEFSFINEESCNRQIYMYATNYNLLNFQKGKVKLIYG